MRHISARNTCADLETSGGGGTTGRIGGHLTFDLECKVLGQTSTFMVAPKKEQTIGEAYL